MGYWAILPFLKAPIPSESQMTTQPDPHTVGTWSWAVQSELDGLKRGTEQRLHDMSAKIDNAVSSVEYTADKRFTGLQFDTVNDKIDDLETAIQSEITNRITDQKEDIKTRQAQFRWMISAVLVPIVLAVMDLMLNKK